MISSDCWQRNRRSDLSALSDRQTIAAFVRVMPLLPDRRTVTMGVTNISTNKIWNISDPNGSVNL
jgi:hypothetical protein